MWAILSVRSSEADVLDLLFYFLSVTLSIAFVAPRRIRSDAKGLLNALSFNATNCLARIVPRNSVSCPERDEQLISIVSSSNY